MDRSISCPSTGYATSSSVCVQLHPRLSSNHLPSAPPQSAHGVVCAVGVCAAPLLGLLLLRDEVDGVLRRLNAVGVRVVDLRSNSSSNAITSSTASSESRPRSEANTAVDDTLAGSTFSNLRTTSSTRLSTSARVSDAEGGEEEGEEAGAGAVERERQR